MTQWTDSEANDSAFPAVAAEVLTNLARVFFPDGASYNDAGFVLPAPNSSCEPKQPSDEEARYRSLVEQLPAIVFLASLDGGKGHAYVSPQIESMLGYSPSEWLEDPLRWYQSIHPEDKGRWSADAARTFLSGEPLRATYRIIARDRRVVWFRCEAKVLRAADGQPSFIQGVGFDVTELMETQAKLEVAKNAAETASRTKGEFLMNISHEIRTPMNAVIGMTDLALSSELQDEVRDYLDVVKYSAEALMVIINDILDYSKMEAKKLRLDSNRFCIRDILTQTQKTLLTQARQKGLLLSLQVSRDVPELVTGDAGRLRQILLNLVGNAIKFTAQGEVKVTVEVQTSSTHAVVLHFGVTDTGIGIPTKSQQVIFEPFRQADGSSTRKYGGTGLGLTICSQIVQMMRGRIWLESEVGRGSTFHFTGRFGIPAEAGAEVEKDGERAMA